MLIDFQQHYTPPELLKGEPGRVTVDLDRDGNPHYLLNPLLADLAAHLRMMDASGIDAVELGFPGTVIASELQDLPLDAEELRPFWKTCADLNLYVFIHPLPRVIRWARMNADDLGRMLGWEFSLMTAAVRLINSGLLDELPSLKI